MKIKKDLVTNSSSSSFVVWGESFEVKDFLEKHKDKLNKFNKEYYDDTYDIDDIDDYGINDIICEYLDSKGLSASSCGSDGYYIYVGISPFQIKEDETGNQFKERISQLFKEIDIEIPAEKLKKIQVGWENR